MAERIQRKRTKGWRMPEGAVYVGRPTRWGNPFIPGRHYPLLPSVLLPIDSPRLAVIAFWYWLNIGSEDRETFDARWVDPLRGRDLACWCPLDQPCHADLLLELANR